jgi:hypothetical protein
LGLAVAVRPETMRGALLTATRCPGSVLAVA